MPERRALRMQAAAATAERSGTWLGVRLGHVIRYRMARAWGVYVHPRATLGRVRFPHPTSIVIGAYAVVEDDVVIYQNVTIGSKDNDRRVYPVIRSGARIYAGATVIGGVEVGREAVVGANSVVLTDVAPGATVAGAPAQIVGTRTPMVVDRDDG